MQEIDHGLWISDIDNVHERSTERFDLVVGVCQDAAEDNVGCPYKHYKLAGDAISEKNWGGSAKYSVFRAAAERVVEALHDDEIENVLVHCHAGQNRSAAVCAAALAVYEGSHYEEAFEKVKTARPIVNPNPLMRAHARRFVRKR